MAQENTPERLRVFAEGIELPAAANDGEMVTTQGATKENHDVLVRRENGKIFLQAKNGFTLREIADNAEAAAHISNALETQWRWNFLRGLRNNDANAPLKVDFRLVPLKVRLDVNGKPQEVEGQRPNPEMNGERMVLREGDFVLMQLRNLSATDAYVTVLDLGPDGSISQLFPDPVVVPQYNIVPADGNWHPVFRPFEVGPPFGEEVFKVIATRSYVDFRAAQSAKTVTVSRGAPTLKLGKLLLTSSTAKRDPGPGELVPADWTTTEIICDVKPKAK